jgi:putative chitinase
MMTVGTLVAGGLSPATAALVLEDLCAACARFEINTASRQAHFVGQCFVESEAFQRLAENLTYTTPERILEVFPSHVRTRQQAAGLARNPQGLANCVYAGVNGNDPDPAVGDGWRYRGSGWIQLTGKANFQLAENDTKQPFVRMPDLVRKIAGAALASAAYWKRHGCNELADANDADGCTRRINPKMLQKERRAAMAAAFLQAFT